MATQHTPRLLIPYPDPATNADAPTGPAQMKALALAVDGAVIYGQGALSARPTSTSGSPGIQGRLYYVTGDATTANNGILWYDTGTSWVSVGNPSNFSYSTPSDKPALGSTMKMVGLAGAFTPVHSGNVVFLTVGTLSFGGGGAPALALYYGTGSAPANGASPTGIQIGKTSGGTAFGLVTGLLLGTPYWFDCAAGNTGGGATAQYTGVAMFALEL